MSKVITVQNITAKASKRGGKVIPGQVRQGHHAQIVPGQSIVLFGLTQEMVHSKNEDGTFRVEYVMVPYRTEFKIGGVAEYDSYNLKYTGTIVSITEKTVTIESGKRRYRLDLHAFAWRNYDFDVEAIRARNSEAMTAI